MKDHSIDCLALPLARQAAVLQAMQFAPNGKKWKAALSKGNLKVRSTLSKQAVVLGDTSIGDMEKYYAKFFKKRPPVRRTAERSHSNRSRSGRLRLLRCDGFEMSRA
jgi:hypothetical protein